MGRKYLIFDGCDAPVWEGVYKRHFNTGWVWALWKNNKWYLSARTHHDAKRQITPSFYQLGTHAWMGLTRNEYEQRTK